jgi:hypothetical protein
MKWDLRMTVLWLIRSRRQFKSGFRWDMFVHMFFERIHSHKGEYPKNSEVKFGNLSNTIYVQMAQRFDPHSIPCFVIRTWFSLMLNQIHLLPLPGIPRNTIALGFIKPYQYGCVGKWVTRQRTIFIGNMIETRFWTNWKLARSICLFKDE